MNIHALIIDDEPLARKRIKRLLAQETDISIVGECGSGTDAINTIRETSPNQLFLDIQMPGMSGFDVLQAIPEEQMPAIIFTTAYDQHALKAFEVHALDYLLKPFKQERFKQALERARKQLIKDDRAQVNPGLAVLASELRNAKNYLDRFMVKSSDRVVFVKTADVDWIESAANYALLHAGDKTHVVRETMHALETKLSPKTFQRVSRSAIVNLERVKELQPMGKGQYVIILSNGKQLTMSRGIRDLQQALESC